MAEPADPTSPEGGPAPAAGEGGPSPKAGEDGGEPEHRFTFEGTNADLWPMSLAISLLNLVSLFFYRFWGRTRVRRYLWSRTSFLGDRFSYTGTGKEMFIGFLIVFFLVLLPLAALSALVLYRWPADKAVQGTYFYGLGALTYFLFYMASYRALRYRLSRTNWRGIRGTQAGSSVKYAFKAMGWLLLTGVSMGLTYPLQRVSLTGTKLNNAWFGDRKFEFESGLGTSRLYRPFLRALAGYVFKPIIVIVPVSVLFNEIVTQSLGTKQPVDEKALGALMVVMLALVLLGWLRTYARYKARELAIMAPWARFGDLRFRFETDHNRMFRLILGNMALTFLTLGFARPIAQRRSFRFIAENLRVLGRPDLDSLGQSLDAAPGMGEGLADAFDAGSI